MWRAQANDEVSEAQVIRLFVHVTISHDAHNCCVARFQGSPPVNEEDGLPKVRLSDVHTSSGKGKNKITRSPS